MELRQAYLSIIRAFSGGWDAMAASLGMSRVALENRIYECKGQRLHVETALQMQRLSSTTHFAEAVAAASGGTFIQLPQPGEIENDSIQAKFNEAYAELGHMFQCFLEITADGVIDDKERAQMEHIAGVMHRRTEELTGLMFSVYCKNTGTVKLAPPMGRGR